MNLKNKSFKTVVIIILFTIANPVFAQNTDRYKSEISTEIDTIPNVQYGEAINLKNESEKLLLDIYMPKSDVLKNRPMILFIHGGGFLNGDKSKGYQIKFCKSFAKRGYVTSSINYRLGINKTRTDADFAEAMFRAVQDAKAAVRFFRKYADEYGIDPNQIFISGGSAGSMTALQLAYMDQNEVPETIDQNKWGNLEGKSGNEGFSSSVSGVINCWGAMININWINTGDVPLFSIHGNADLTVSYDGSFSYHGFKYGSKNIYERALSVGIPTKLKIFEGAGHNIGPEKQIIAIEEVNEWLYGLLQNPNLTSNSSSVLDNALIKKQVIIDYPKTIVLRGEALQKNYNAIKGNDTSKKASLKHLLGNADKILAAAKLYSVMDKKQVPPSGDKHDYMSTGPYWWPDPTKPDGLPYIKKDGQRNPEYYEITDSQKMDKVEDDVETLALAYYFSKEEKYAEYAAKLIKTWFLSAETLQNPNLNFGQGIKGINTGRGTGIIETRALYRISDAAILLQDSKSWLTENHKALKKWFSDYLTWMVESPIGKDEADSKNNHGTYYSVQVIAFALFAERPEIARNEVEIFKKRMESQIQPDGSLPLELERTKSWNYVNMNLLGFCLSARLGEHLKIDLWNYQTPQGKSIKKCIDWLMPYIKKEKTWDRDQIVKFSYEETISVLLGASNKYPSTDYAALAKETDTKSFQSDFNQLVN